MLVLNLLPLVFKEREQFCTLNLFRLRDRIGLTIPLQRVRVQDCSKYSLAHFRCQVKLEISIKGDKLCVEKGESMGKTIRIPVEITIKKGMVSVRVIKKK